MTNEEFIRRLKKARKLALTKYKSRFRIVQACNDVGIYPGENFWNNATISGLLAYEGFLSLWLYRNGNTEANVRAVFDNSIKALGGKP